jgi:hypothetical protein
MGYENMVYLEKLASTLNRTSINPDTGKDMYEAASDRKDVEKILIRFAGELF